MHTARFTHENELVSVSFDSHLISLKRISVDFEIELINLKLI